MDSKKTIRSMTNIKPNEDQIFRIEAIRGIYKEVVKTLGLRCKDSRELDIAVENLEQSLMWAVKSIVLEDKQENL